MMRTARGWFGRWRRLDIRLPGPQLGDRATTPVSASPLYRLLFAHCWLAFLLKGICFVAFGAISLNLVQSLVANFEFLGRFGLVAVREGALRQLVELVASGYSAAAFYLGFKLCEKVLIDRLCAAPVSAAATCADRPDAASESR